VRFYYDKHHGVYLNARDIADTIQQVINNYKDKPTTPERENIIFTLESVVLAIEEQRKKILNDVC
jgi:hypothetical protein